MPRTRCDAPARRRMRDLALLVAALAVALAVPVVPGVASTAAAAGPGAVPRAVPAIARVGRAASVAPGAPVGPDAPAPRPLAWAHACSAPARPTDMRCHALVRTDLPPARTAAVSPRAAGASGAGAAPALTGRPAGTDATAAAVTGLTPADLQDAYGLTAASAAYGSGTVIAIVDAYDAPSAESDLATYRARFGLPPCTTGNGCFRKVNQRGATTPMPAYDPGWSQEIALDLDMASAICPRCSLLLVEADSASMADLVAGMQRAIRMGARFVSNSYGNTEMAGADEIDNGYYDVPGVVITASTGDAGYGVQFPAAAKHVIAVGGTSLTWTGSAWAETAWAHGGSGCSAYVAKPSWQSDPACPNRMVGDLAAAADPDHGVSVAWNGSWYIFGGTSASAPMVAAAYALAGTPADGTYPVVQPYTRRGLRDITSGANGTCATAYFCRAVPGYDGPTGLGSLQGTAPLAASNPPGAPVITGAVAGNATATVTWTAPADTGGTAVIGYTATSSPGGRTCSWSAGPLSCTVSGLTNGVVYTLTVRAVNAAGPGAASLPSPAVTPATVPGAPQDVTAVPGTGEAAVTWTAPATNGGSTITGYTATAAPGGAGCAWSTGPLGCTVTGLVNGTPYTFTVTATNAKGTGPASGPSAQVIPARPPGSPVGVAAAPGDATATVTWAAPADDGGAPVTGYTVTSSPDGRTCSWTAGPLACTVTGLTNGTPYTFTVTAWNGAATSAGSAPSLPVTPAGTPDAPRSVEGTPGDRSVTVRWSAPASDGGAPVTGYTATAQPGGRTCTWSGGPLACTTTGLTNGTAYTFTVTATNREGTGAPSLPSGPVTPRTVPGAPSGVAASAGNASAWVTWSAPADDGGAPVTGYTAIAEPGGARCTWSAGPLACAITGLVNGTAYTITVSATNVAGDGAGAAGAAPVLPDGGLPGRPAAVSVTPAMTSGTIEVTWSPPADDGGHAVLAYTAIADPSGASCTVAAPATRCAIAGLTPGSAAWVRVAATTAAGTGTPSDPVGPVVPPLAGSVVVGALPVWTLASRVDVTWAGAPGTNPISVYDLRVRTAASSSGFGAYRIIAAATAAASATASVSPGTTACFSVRARDSVGFPSSWSAERCTAVPLDDRGLTTSGRWTRATGAGYYRATAISTTASGSTAKRASVAASRIALVATTCPTCGTVRVYLGSTLLRTIRLTSATTVNRRVIAAASFASVRTGTITVKVISSGRRVRIDGLATSRR